MTNDEFAERVRMLALDDRKPFPDFPEVMGRTTTREEIIDGIRECYDELKQLKREKESDFVGYPDYETILDWIEENGLPPKT